MRFRISASFCCLWWRVEMKSHFNNTKGFSDSTSEDRDWAKITDHPKKYLLVSACIVGVLIFSRINDIFLTFNFISILTSARIQYCFSTYVVIYHCLLNCFRQMENLCLLQNVGFMSSLYLFCITIKYNGLSIIYCIFFKI